MPTYEFKSVDGRTIEVQAPISAAPPYGSVQIVDGVEYIRFPEATAGAVRDYRCASVRWPKKGKWIDSTGKGHPAKKFAPNGDMVTETRRDVEDFKAECKSRGIEAGWNG